MNKKNNGQNATSTESKSERLTVDPKEASEIKAGVPSYVHGKTFGDTCWGVIAWALN
jgi:hypothetical protein